MYFQNSFVKGFASLGCDALGRCGNDRRGNISIMAAVSLIPIVGIIGFSIDYSRANATRSKVQAAADAAALAATTIAVNGGTSSAAQTAASEVAAASLGHIPGLSYNSSTNPAVSVSNLNGVVSTTVSFSGAVNTIYTGLLGLPTLPVTVRSGATGAALSPLPGPASTMALARYRRILSSWAPMVHRNCLSAITRATPGTIC